jgi:hypothetical protein
MTNTANASHSWEPADPSRRRLLIGMLTVYTASLIPWAVAQTAPDHERGAFMALSAIIAGCQALNAELTALYFDALTEADPQFPAAVSEVLKLIEEQQIEPLQLQALLDEHQPQFAAVPRKIATAWFMGIVSDGKQAHSLAYADALNAVLVGDVLKPPSYCYGAYGSWTRKPTEG